MKTIKVWIVLEERSGTEHIMAALSSEAKLDAWLTANEKNKNSKERVFVPIVEVWNMEDVND